MAEADEGFSLRPGGFSLRPGGGAVTGKAIAFGAFALGSGVSAARVKKSSEEVIRYSRDVLLSYQEHNLTVPDAIAELDLDGFLADEDGEVSTEPRVGPGAAAVPGETDGRDWRTRTPLPPPKEGEGSPGPKAETRGPGEKGTARRTTEGSGRTSGQGGASAQVLNPAVLTIKTVEKPYVIGGAGSATDRVYRTVKGILNKLTPEKFERLLAQMLEAGITTADVLQGSISLVFEKAVAEPTFCALYAELCMRLSKALPEFPAPEGEDKPMTFRRVLLNTCQEEFEGTAAARAALFTVKYASTEAYDAAERAVRMRTLGNIRLVGELFKKKILPEKIVTVCVQQLLADVAAPPPAKPIPPPEENIEAACNLLSTVGKALDASPKGTAKLLDQCFSRLQQLAKAKAMTSRVRFMIKDITELRQAKWVPRKEEVRVDIDSAASSAAHLITLGAPEEALELFPEGPGGKPVEWEVVGKKKPAVAPAAAPRPAAPQAATSTAPAASGDADGRTPFSALTGAFQPRAEPVAPPPKPTPAAEPPPPVAPAAVAPPKPAAKAALVLSTEEDFIAWADKLLVEYLAAADVKDAVACVSELPDATHHASLADRLVAKACDTPKEREQDLLVSLLVALGAAKVLSGPVVAAAADTLLESIADVAIDAPLAPKALGKLVARLAAAGLYTLDGAPAKLAACDDDAVTKAFAEACVATLKADKTPACLHKVADPAARKLFGLAA